MFAKFFKNLFNSNLDYYPRFIDKNAYKKTIAKSSSDLDDYKELKNNIEAPSYGQSALYAYSLIRK
ncbi:MAG: hypothetical protein WCF95_00370 [bacterium]